MAVAQVGTRRAREQASRSPSAASTADRSDPRARGREGELEEPADRGQGGQVGLSPILQRPEAKARK